MKDKGFRIWDIASIALSALFLVGTLTFMKPCAAHEDGSWMSCHWAGQALMGIAALLTALSVMKCVVRGTGAKRGLALSMIPAALLAALLPGSLIDLCMMDTMRCHQVTQPGATVFGCLIAAISLADFALLRHMEKSTR